MITVGREIFLRGKDLVWSLETPDLRYYCSFTYSNEPHTLSQVHTKIGTEPPIHGTFHLVI